MRRGAVAAALSLALAACQPEAEPANAAFGEPAKAGTAEPVGDAALDAGSLDRLAQSPSGEAGTPVTDPTDASDEPSEPAPDLPLRKGAYVLAGTSCTNPANAGFRIWDGNGLSGSATRECRASPVVRSGDIITVEQSCIDTYTGRRSSVDFRIRIADDRHFTLLDDPAQSFAYCPIDDLPGWLRDAVSISNP